MAGCHLSAVDTIGSCTGRPGASCPGAGEGKGSRAKLLVDWVLSISKTAILRGCWKTMPYCLLQRVESQTDKGTKRLLEGFGLNYEVRTAMLPLAIFIHPQMPWIGWFPPRNCTTNGRSEARRMRPIQIMQRKTPQKGVKKSQRTAMSKLLPREARRYVLASAVCHCRNSVFEKV